MSKYVLIPDSFKGTLSSAAICRAMAQEIHALEPDARIVSIPVADGGEGTVEAFLTAVGGERVEAACKGPYFEDITGYFAMLPGGIAVVEMAVAAGLPMVGERRNAEATTTYGVGQLIAAALDRGARQVILGLGGSATNDGGCGAAAALGVEFLDEAGRAFIPVGGTLHRITRIRTDGLMPRLREAEVIAMCDIDNPLCGETGAAAVFGPQKGADAQTVRLLDDGLRHLAEVIERDLGGDLLDLPGGGAAGGFGAGSAAFFGAKLQMGIETVLELVDFDRLAADADLVITGEGRLDSQSLRGKVVIGVARRAQKLGVPAAALVGSCELPAEAAYETGVSGIFPIHPEPMSLAEAMARTREHLAFTAGNMLRFVKAAGKMR